MSRTTVSPVNKWTRDGKNRLQSITTQSAAVQSTSSQSTSAATQVLTSTPQQKLQSAADSKQNKTVVLSAIQDLLSSISEDDDELSIQGENNVVRAATTSGDEGDQEDDILGGGAIIDDLNLGEPSQQFQGGELNNSIVSDGDADFVQSHTGESDTESYDEDTEMASNALMPNHFKGQSSEDSEEWWGDVEHWCAYRKLNNDERVGLIPLLLKEGARQWFEALPAAEKDTFDHIRESFQNQYKRDEVYKWKDSAEVWSTTQKSDQSVEDYFAAILKKAMRAKLSEEQTLFCVINGLKHGIRQAVLQHEPKNIQDVRKWGMIAESSGTEAESTNLMGVVKRLEEKIDKISVHEVSSASRDKRSSSPRVTFDESPRVRWTSPGRSSQDDYNGQQQQWSQRESQWQTSDRPVYNSDRGSQRGRGITYSSYRGSRGHGRGGWRDNSTERGYSQPGYSQTGQSQTQNNFGWDNRLQQSQQYAGQCPQCGLFHTNNQRCPAQGRTCHNCGKGNHFRSVCRQARNTQVQQ